MSNVQKPNSNPIKGFFDQDNVQIKFNELLGKRSSAFLTSVLQLVNSNNLLAKADPMSIYSGAVMAATLDLPLNNNLGFAYLIPYGDKAQFQLGYKGYIQLAQRSGQFRTISAAPVYEGQILKEDPLIGFEFDFSQKKSDKVVGYASFFRLINGFEKTFYMRVEQMEEHGSKYSKTFHHKNGVWKTDFNSMAMKTVLKLLLSKYAPLSVDMQTAVTVDQGVIDDTDTQDISYVDNDSYFQKGGDGNPERERVLLMINDSESIKELEELNKAAKIIDASSASPRYDDLSTEYNTKYSELLDIETAKEEAARRF